MAETTKMMHVHKIHISNRLPNRMFSTAFEMLPATLRKVAITRERTASRFWRNWTPEKVMDVSPYAKRFIEALFELAQS